MIESLARYCIPVALTLSACDQADPAPKLVLTQPQSRTFDAASPALPPSTVQFDAAMAKPLALSPPPAVQLDAATPKPAPVVATCKSAKLCTRRSIARFLVANAGKQTPVGCSEDAGIRGTPTVAQLVKRLKKAPISSGQCTPKPSNPEILHCRLQYGGPANETHGWSGTLSFDVETEGPTLISDINCEILG